MSTPIHNIDQITCSLYVGDQVSIYSFDYDYQPSVGTKITIYFVSQGGTYNVPTTINQNATILSVLQKTQITIGSALFAMYPLSYELDLNVERKVLKVEFVDDTFMLENYHVVLTGTFCGDRVYPLGAPVDPRTDAQRVAQALDGTVQNIKNQTITLDVEYHFSDFIPKLNLAFPRSVIVNASWDDTITKPFVGTFRQVLDAWTQYHNLVYYFEEGSLTINNPQSLNITFPTIPADAIAAKQSESLSNTFTATACVAFNQDGGQYGANGVGTESSSLALYPAGAEFDLPQPIVDLNQVAAAAYGQEYWFVYNYLRGTATTECGWTRIILSEIPAGTLKQSITLLNGDGIASFDTSVFNQRFQFYSQYGKDIAGRYYMSEDQGGSIYSQQTYKWYDQTAGQTFNLQALLNSNTPTLPIEFYLEGVNPGNGYIDGTAINRYYAGVQANGNRLLFKDTRNIDLTTPFTLSTTQASLITTYYTALTQGIQGSSALPYDQIGAGNIQYVTFKEQIIDTTTIPGSPTDDQVNLFLPAYPVINLVGLKAGSPIQANAPNGSNNLVTTTQPGNITTTNSLTTLAQPDANIYYPKYLFCASQSSLGKAGSRGAYRHRFNSRTQSVDTPTPFSVNKGAANVYSISRALSFLALPAQGGASDQAANILTKTSTPQIQSLKQLDFSLNYYYPGIPTSRFITNGLTSMSVAISEGGVTASYTFSNSMLDITSRDETIFFDNLEKNMRNSWIRQYNPPQNTQF